MRSPALAALPLISALAWTAALVVEDGGFDPISVLLLGIGLIVMATVSTAGMLLSGGRWARRYGFATVAACVLVAIARPIDVIWFVALAVTAAALGALFSPGVTDRVRQLPNASGPPPLAVLLPLLLIAVPFVTGLTMTGEAWAMATLSGTALMAAFAYARVVPGGLTGVRIAWPLIAFGLSPFLGLAGGLITVGLGLAVLIVAWQPSVKVAFHPPAESGTSYPIPPELTPREVLDAAQIDDTGKPT